MRSTVIAQFLVEPVKNEFKSAEAGRDVYDDIEHIRILVAGERDEIFRIATDEDKQTFGDEYKRFKAQINAPASGTPLTELPGVSSSFVKEMAFFNVTTVEQLADMSEGSRAANTMGAREWVAKAQAYLAKANGDDAAITKIAAENEALKKRLEEMEARLNAKQAEPADPDADGDGKLSPLERGMQAARDGKPRNVPPAYRGKPAGEEWELGYDEVKKEGADKAA